MKIVCDNKIPFLQGVFEPFAEVVYLPGSETTAEVVRDADAIITRTRTRCDASLLAGSSVQVVATATIGFDHIDTTWCAEHGILWRNAPGCNAGSVAQYVGAALCTLARRHGLDLSRMTLGVVGVGHVGRKVARLAEALGMRVLLCDPPRARREGGDGFVSLDEIVAQCDIVSLHVPLSREGTDATWHLFDAARLASMRPDQWLFNAARGPVVDNAALKAALAAGTLRGAVLDTWEGEPDIDRELLDMLEIATPHIAGYSADGKANGTMASVRAVAGQLGLPLLDWRPTDLPAARHPLLFSLGAAFKSPREVLGSALLYTYDILADDRALREHPEWFEQLRGDYPVRREPEAFTLRLRGGADDLVRRLRALGFKVFTES